MPTLAPSLRALILSVVVVIATAPPALADPLPGNAAEAGTEAAAPKDPRPKVQASHLPPGVELYAESISQDQKDGSVVAEGAVTLKSNDGRIQADRIVFREGHIVDAQGNVLIVWGNNRISGTSMIYDMGIKDSPDPKKRIAHGVIQQAIGQVDPEFYFDAESVETIGQDRIILHSATVTTCTQPVPYWSFAVSTAKIKVEGYAHMFNLRPRIKNVPFFYLPYLAWPVKHDRAIGLLFPEFGSTSTRGRVISIPLFVPLGPSADVTVFGEWYSIAGWGGGAKFRLMPNRDGYAEAQAHYIQDQVTGAGRYQFTLKQTQSFLNGFRMVSDVDLVSDFDYYTDFVRNLTTASSPTILGRVSFTRNGSWTSLLVQEQYREQLFSDGSTLVQTTLPEVQWRGRSHKLGKTPMYFSYVSSAAWIGQNGSTLDASYYRADLAPTLSIPLSPAPWLDITPTLGVRTTYWSDRQTPSTVPGVPATVTSDALWRNLLGASIDFAGPRIFRIFEKETKDGTRKIKNTIEPRATYSYQQAFDKADEVIRYDEVDTFGSNANSITYGVASRVIAQRARSSIDASGGSGERILIPDSASGQLREAPVAAPEESQIAPPSAPPSDASPAAGAPPAAKDAAAPLEPIEVANFEITQSRSFNSTLSSGDVNGDCAAAVVPVAGCLQTSHFSPLSLTARYNPSRVMNFNLGSRYDILFHEVSEVSVSGNFLTPDKIAQGLFSFVYRPGLGYQRKLVADPATGILFPVCDATTCQLEPVHDTTQVRFQGNFGPIAGRLRLGMDATMNVDPPPNTKRIPYQRWRLEYYTQCCGFLTEYLINDYSAFQRKEFRFAIDLRGIGKLFDFNQGLP
jgi:LPS-assembly protein